jgi:hypothetical protein
MSHHQTHTAAGRHTVLPTYVDTSGPGHDASRSVQHHARSEIELAFGGAGNGARTRDVNFGNKKTAVFCGPPVSTSILVRPRIVEVCTQLSMPFRGKNRGKATRYHEKNEARAFYHDSYGPEADAWSTTPGSVGSRCSSSRPWHSPCCSCPFHRYLTDESVTACIAVSNSAARSSLPPGRAQVRLAPECQSDAWPGSSTNCEIANEPYLVDSAADAHPRGCTLLLDCSWRQECSALRVGDAGQAGDIHALVAALAAQGAPIGATTGLPQPDGAVGPLRKLVLPWRRARECLPRSRSCDRRTSGSGAT